MTVTLFDNNMSSALFLNGNFMSIGLLAQIVRTLRVVSNPCSIYWVYPHTACRLLPNISGGEKHNIH